MTWTVNLLGHDDLSGDEKEQFENGLVDTIRSVAADLKATEGCNVTTASVTTNTTGSVNVLE